MINFQLKVPCSLLLPSLISREVEVINTGRREKCCTPSIVLRALSTQPGIGIPPSWLPLSLPWALGWQLKLYSIYWNHSGVSLVSIPVRVFTNGSVGKEPICNAGDTGDAGLMPGLGRSSEKEMATHSGILAWKLSWTEEPAGLQSKGSERVRHNWVTKHIHQRAASVQHDHISQPGNSCPGQMSSEWETGTQVSHSSVLGRAAIEVMLAVGPICLEVACKWAHVHTGFWQTCDHVRLSCFLTGRSLAASFSYPSFDFLISKIRVLLTSLGYCED